MAQIHGEIGNEEQSAADITQCPGARRQCVALLRAGNFGKIGVIDNDRRTEGDIRDNEEDSAQLVGAALHEVQTHRGQCTDVDENSHDHLA